MFSIQLIAKVCSEKIGQNSGLKLRATEYACELRPKFLRETKCRNFRRKVWARIAGPLNLRNFRAKFETKNACYTKIVTSFGQKYVHQMKCRNFRQNLCVRIAGSQNLRKTISKFSTKNIIYTPCLQVFTNWSGCKCRTESANATNFWIHQFNNLTRP